MKKMKPPNFLTIFMTKYPFKAVTIISIILLTNTIPSDKYITIKNEYGITLANPKIFFCGTFVGNENSSDKIEYKYDEDSLYFGMANNAYIDFDSFRSSMTDAQYEKITQYLNDKPTDKELYYELVCTEFYVSNSVLIKPKNG